MPNKISTPSTAAPTIFHTAIVGCVGSKIGVCGDGPRVLASTLRGGCQTMFTELF